jgi:hypothetical protein
MWQLWNLEGAGLRSLLGAGDASLTHSTNVYHWLPAPETQGQLNDKSFPLGASSLGRKTNQISI